MNKKKIILLFILTLIGILCVFLNGKEEPEIGVGQNKVSFSNKTNSFYYDQLDETEKRVCNDITALVAQGNGGKIDLTDPISTYRYLRIVRTLSFDPEYQNWAISLIFPVGENNKLIDRNTINDDCNIMKLYVLVNDSKKRKELKNFKLVLNDENIITNIDELEKICKSADFSTEYYQEKSKEIDACYDEIIREMPKNMNEKEAVQYFLNWIKDNMEYDYSVYESSIEPYYDKLYENEVYADASNKGCILDKRGICGGISIILSELCNRVGITAYPVFGTIKSDGTLIPHGWVAMRVDDSTYYIDPTYVCQTGEMDNLKMKNEMEHIGDRQYQLEDSFEY